MELVPERLGLSKKLLIYWDFHHSHLYVVYREGSKILKIPNQLLLGIKKKTNSGLMTITIKNTISGYTTGQTLK